MEGIVGVVGGVEKFQNYYNINFILIEKENKRGGN